MEAAEADELAWMVDLDLAGIERRRSLGLGWRGVAGDEIEAADPAVEAMPPEDPPDAVGPDDDAAPPFLGEGGCDPSQPYSGCYS